MSDNPNNLPTEPMSIYDHLMHITDLITQVSWAKLGLQPDIMTGKLETNLAEAKVAIDVTAFLVSQIENELEDEDRRELHKVVRDLRINYVRKTSEVGG